MWSQRWELNPRPLPYQGNALPLSYTGFKFGKLNRNVYLKLNQQKANLVRARDQVRTGDIQLGRLTLYQLSYFRVV